MKYEWPTLSVDDESYEVRVDGTRIEMGTRETRLLAFLAEQYPRAMKREEIYKGVWGRDNPNQDFEYDPKSNLVEVYIYYLREYLRSVTRVPIIRTVRGVGYALRVPTFKEIEKEKDHEGRLEDLDSLEKRIRERVYNDLIVKDGENGQD